MDDMRNIMNKAKHLMSLAGKKTSNAMEISKLNLQVAQINTMIQSTYERIGLLYYNQEKTEKDNSNLISICIAEIDSLLNNLREINDKIASLKNGAMCRKCGVVNPIESIYCAKCGASLKANVNDI